MPRFAANLTFMFTEAPFLERFALAAQCGFTAVEFAFPYDHSPDVIASLLAKHGLQQVLFNLPPGNWDAGDRGLAAMPGREAEFRRGVEQALGYARALKCSRLHAMAGALPDESHDAARARCRETYVENLRFAATAMAAEGVTLLIEPLSRRVIPGYLLERQDDAHALRAEVGHAALAVQMDIYHAQIVEGDLTAKIARWLPHIGHIQIAGVPDRHEPDSGEVNYAYLFARLDELGYAGWIGCEYKPRGRTVDGLGWMRTLA
jgi:hydroxypyruvate isomerase